AAAAAAVGLRLDFDDLVRRGEALAARGTFLLVEGAGGLLVPYRAGATNADLAARLRLPVLVVARTALGTINHVALTLSELARRALPVAGVVLVRTAEAAGPHEDANAELIAELTGTRPLGTIPFLPASVVSDADRVADAVAAALPAAALSRLLAEAT